MAFLDETGLKTFKQKCDATYLGKNANAVSASGVVDYNNSANIIKIGWSGDSLTASTMAYGIGYSSDKKIKDISKSEFQGWLGLGPAAYTNISDTIGSPGRTVYLYGGDGNGGVIEIGGYIDFHRKDTNKDYDFRIFSPSSGNIAFSNPLPVGSGGTGGTNGASARNNLGIKSGSSVPSSDYSGSIFIQV